jgi:hypothetical protein
MVAKFTGSDPLRTISKTTFTTVKSPMDASKNNVTYQF